MSLSGTEIIYDEDAPLNTEALSPTQSRANHHQTQSSLSQTFVNDGGHLILLTPDKQNDDNIDNKTTSMLKSMQSQSTEYSNSIQNQIYLNSLNQNNDNNHISFPLYEQIEQEQASHSNTNSNLSISSKGNNSNDGDSLYHDPNNSLNSLNIDMLNRDSLISDDTLNSNLNGSSTNNEHQNDISRLDSTDSTFVGIDKNIIKMNIINNNTNSNNNDDNSNSDTDDDDDDDENLIMLDESEYNRECQQLRRSSQSICSDDSSINDLFKHHRPPTEILNRINLQKRRLKEEQSSPNTSNHSNHSNHSYSSNSISDDTQTHHSKYLINVGVAIDDQSDDNGHGHNHNTKFDQNLRGKNLSDLIQDIQNIQDKQELDICSKLEKKVTTEIERKWHDRFNQQKLDSDLQIMRLQHQLTAISAQLNETKRVHQQLALMSHSPFIHSNQTQKISNYNSNKSRISMSALSDRDEDNITLSQSSITEEEEEEEAEDEYNTSEDEHIEYNANETSKSRKEREKRESFINTSDSPMCHIFNIPSNPYLFNNYSNISNGSRISINRRSSSSISNRPSINLQPIKINIAGYNHSNTTPIKQQNSKQIKVNIDKTQKPKDKIGEICDAKIEQVYLKRKQTQNENSLLWTWFNHYTCLNFKLCWNNINQQIGIYNN